MKQQIKCIATRYDESSNITHQGNRKSIQPYINQGYYVKSDNYGNWVLYKPARVIATLEGPAGNLVERNIKDYITTYFNKSRISYTQYLNFCKLISDGKIRFFIDEYDNYSIEW